MVPHTSTYKFIFTLVLEIAAVSVPGWASSVTASATAGANNCLQTDPLATSCSVRAPLSTGLEAASSFAVATWDQPGVLCGLCGRVEANAYSSGPTHASATANWSKPFVVTTVSRAGDLLVTLTFTAVQTVTANSPASASVSPITLTVGDTTSVITLPGSRTSFSVTIPLTVGEPIPFSASLSAMASGSTTFIERAVSASADGFVSFPSFKISDATGASVVGSVAYLPEPGSFGLLTCAVIALGAWSLRKTRRV